MPKYIHQLSMHRQNAEVHPSVEHAFAKLVRHMVLSTPHSICTSTRHGVLSSTCHGISSSSRHRMFSGTQHSIFSEALSTACPSRALAKACVSIAPAR
eukprot:6196770-Pleurochrysis_carterae.AAC.5